MGYYESMETLVIDLKRQLRRKRLSLNWASRTLEISNTQLSRLFAGEAKPDAEVADRIKIMLEAFQVLEKIAI